MPAYESLNPEFSPKPHQERFAQKLLANGSMVAAQGVGTGKCLRGGTPIWTTRGLLRIDDLFPSNWDGVENWFSSTDWLEVLSLSSGGEIVRSKPDLLYAQRLPPEESTLRFTTKRGLTFEVTKRHPLPTLRGGEVVWVPAGEWKVGDVLCTPGVGASPLNPVRVSPALLELLAWQITEGHDGIHGSACITQADTAVLERLKLLYKDLHPEGSAAIVIPKDRCAFLRIGFTGEYKSLAGAVGYAYGHRSAEKKLPDSFLNLPDDQTVDLLRILFEAEGSVTTDPHSVEFPSASELLCRQVQTLLSFLGIRSSLKSKIGCATNGKKIMRRYWRVTLYGADVRMFRDKVGFLGAAKSEILASVADPASAWTTYGAPVGDVFRELLDRGFGFALRGTNKRRTGPAAPSILIQAAACLRQGPGCQPSRAGFAAKWRQRTEAAIREHGDWALAMASRLEYLASGVLTFDPISSVEEGEAGGIVYDLSVPEHHNFIACHGGVILHNTLSSLYGFDRLRKAGKVRKVLVVTPAGLKKNYADAVARFSSFSHQIVGPKGDKEGVYFDSIDPGKTITITSYELFRRDPVALVKQTGADMLIFDEFHKAKDPGGSTYRAGVLARGHVKSFVGLTGSVVNNDPVDIVPLVNLAAGKQIMSPSEFNSRYKRRYARTKGFFGGDTYLTTLQRLPELKTRISPYVDYISSDELGNEMPRRKVEEVAVEMSKEQQQFYDFAMKKLDPVTALRIRQGLPVDQKSAQHIFGMIQQARQAANSIGPFVKGLSLADAAERTPKTKKVMDDVEDHLKNTPDGQVVVYSNLIKGGVDALAAGLRARGLDPAVFVGKGREVNGEKITSDMRNQGVTDYMAGKKKIIIISPAGAEGLDLKNSTMFAGLDGHFNPERTHQAEARARRLGGLSQRPLANREVLIRRYESTYPQPSWLGRMFGRKGQSTTDQWITSVAKEKDKLNNQLLSALKQKPLLKAKPKALVPVAPVVPVAAVTPQKVSPLRKYLRRWKNTNNEWEYEYAK